VSRATAVPGDRPSSGGLPDPLIGAIFAADISGGRAMLRQIAMLALGGERDPARPFVEGRSRRGWATVGLQ